MYCHCCDARKPQVHQKGIIILYVLGTCLPQITAGLCAYVLSSLSTSAPCAAAMQVAAECFKAQALNRNVSLRHSAAAQPVL